MNKNKIKKTLYEMLDEYYNNFKKHLETTKQTDFATYYRGGYDALSKFQNKLISENFSDIEKEIPVTLMREDLKPSQFYLFDYFLAIDHSLCGDIKKRYNSIEEVEKDKNFFYDRLYGVIREKERVILIEISLSEEESNLCVEK